MLSAPRPSPSTPGLAPAIIGELKNRIDAVWNAFRSGGISNPLEVIEQITSVLFVRRLDDLEPAAEKESRVTGIPIPRPSFDPTR